MSKRNILVTGGAGFIGSNFLNYIVPKSREYNFINLDKLTYAGDLDNVKDLAHLDNYHFIKGDICNLSLVEDVFSMYKIRGVIHFAAESHVDNSISSPYDFIKTNIIGTYNLLDTARKTWMEVPHVYKEEHAGARFHHISTDEVYGTLGSEGLFTETTPYAPNSPYSASKASSDFIARAYKHTYGLDIVMSNCSNNYGYMQHDEKLIPTIIRNALALKHIPIYGDGKNIRDWLYVEDHCRAIELIFLNGLSGESYNVGGHNERTNLQVVNTICDILDRLSPREDGQSYKDLITFVKDRAGHDLRYAIDATKLETELGWKAQENFDSGIEKTVKWYINKYK